MSYVAYSPCTTGYIQNTLAVLRLQEADEEFLVVIGAGVFVSNKDFPNLGGLSIGILITNTLGTDTLRTGYENTIGRIGSHDGSEISVTT